jgi:hypothetical protein
VNLYAFIASIVSSLAWPILFAGLIFLAMGRSKTLEGTIETIRESWPGRKKEAWNGTTSLPANHQNGFVESFNGGCATNASTSTSSPACLEANGT